MVASGRPCGSCQMRCVYCVSRLLGSSGNAGLDARIRRARQAAYRHRHRGSNRGSQRVRGPMAGRWQDVGAGRFPRDVVPWSSILPVGMLPLLSLNLPEPAPARTSPPGAPPLRYTKRCGAVPSRVHLALAAGSLAIWGLAPPGPFSALTSKVSMNGFCVNATGRP
jgi:hypothetical protein